MALSIALVQKCVRSVLQRQPMAVVVASKVRQLIGQPRRGRRPEEDHKSALNNERMTKVHLRPRRLPVRISADATKGLCGSWKVQWLAFRLAAIKTTGTRIEDWHHHTLYDRFPSTTLQSLEVSLYAAICSDFTDHILLPQLLLQYVGKPRSLILLTSF